MTDEHATHARLLAEHPLTAGLPEAVRRRLSTVTELRRVAPGEVLVEEGAAGPVAFLITSGRLTALVGGTVVGTIGRGETVGEMSLITGSPRSATVVARRPSVALALGGDEFATLLAEHPDTHRALTAQLVARLDGTLRGSPSGSQATVVAFVGASDAEGRLVEAVVAAMLACGEQAVVLDGPDLDEVGRAEADNDVVLVRLAPGAGGDRRVVGGAGSSPSTGPYDRVVLVARATDTPVPLDGLTDLVLLHPDTITRPVGTRRWLVDVADGPVAAATDAPSPVNHHHVRLGVAADVGRVARRLAGRERILVLGGGGARGMAHLGLYQALSEADIEIDGVVGVSAGAIFAACIALDWTPDEAIGRSTSILVDAGRLVDPTAPVVALGAGRRMTAAIQHGFGSDVDLLDLWRPMLCLSADLTSLAPRYHRAGPLWRALRASVAVPGVFPPLLEGDAVLVDGGVVDNLPVVPARAVYPGGTIISSDVGRRNEPMMAVDLPPDGVVNGWRALWHRVGRRRSTPTVVRLLYRLTAIGGAADQEVGDVHVAYELGGVGMFDFAGARPAIEAGRQQAAAVLAMYPELRGAES